MEGSPEVSSTAEASGEKLRSLPMTGGGEEGHDSLWVRADRWVWTRIPLAGGNLMSRVGQYTNVDAWAGLVQDTVTPCRHSLEPALLLRFSGGDR